jgi:hypothetical protein
MPVDVSSYQQEPTSPFDTLGKLTSIQSQANQNKLFQQEYNSKLGLSQIYKDAVDPSTGQFDPAKIPGLINGPNGANITLGLPQAIQNSQEARQRQLGIGSSEVDLNQKHRQLTGTILSDLLNSPEITDDAVERHLIEANTSGALSTPDMVKLYGMIPRTPDGRIDQQKTQDVLRHMQLQLMDPQARLTATNPAPVMQDMGNQIGMFRNPQIGAPSMVGTIAKGLPPNTPVFNAQTNQMGYLGTGGGGGGMGGGGAGAGRGGFIPSGAPLGSGAAADVDATASANQGVSLQQMADQVPARKALLGNLEGALDRFTSGPGQNWKQVAATFANANSPFGQLFDAKAIASQEEFNKQSTQLAQSQFQSLGGTGTDAKLDSAMHTSPNDALSKLGNKGIIAMLKGNEDAINVKNQSWQAYKQDHGAQSYGQFSTQFNKSYDPRVFQSQYLTVDDRKKMLSGMSKAEQKGFLNSYRTAINNGWVKLPGAQ